MLEIRSRPAEPGAAVSAALAALVERIVAETIDARVAMRATEGRYLAGCTATSPWMISETAFRLLLDTASDVALPWHWRNLCLDQAWRPLRDLEQQSLCRCRLKRWQSHAWALATCALEPSIPLIELVQGSPDE